MISLPGEDLLHSIVTNPFNTFSLSNRTLSILLVILCATSTSRRQSPSPTKVERGTVQAALTLGDADIPHTLPPPPGTSLPPVAPLTRHDYLYPIEKLPIKRMINLNVPVNEFYDMAYMAEGMLLTYSPTHLPHVIVICSFSTHCLLFLYSYVVI